MQADGRATGMQVVWESLHSTLLVILLLCLMAARGVGRQYVRRHARARHEPCGRGRRHRARAAAFQVADEIGLYLAAGTEVAAVAGAM